MNYPCGKMLSKFSVLFLTFIMILSLNGCATSSKKNNAELQPEEKLKLVQQHTNHGDLALQRSDYKKAIYYYLAALKLDDGNTDILYKVGAIHRQIGDLDTARKAFEQILINEPAHSGALEEQGLILLQKRNYEQAIVNLLESIRIDAERWRAYNAMGIISDIYSNHQTAIWYYQKALGIRNNNPMLINNLGYSYYLNGNWKSAEEYFKKSISLDPKYSKALSNLGMLYVRQGRYSQALDILSRDMEKPEAYLNMGYISMLEGKYGKAEGFFMSAIKYSSTYYEEAHESLERVRSNYLATIK